MNAPHLARSRPRRPDRALRLLLRLRRDRRSRGAVAAVLRAGAGGQATARVGRPLARARRRAHGSGSRAACRAASSPSRSPPRPRSPPVRRRPPRSRRRARKAAAAAVMQQFQTPPACRRRARPASSRGRCRPRAPRGPPRRPPRALPRRRRAGRRPHRPPPDRRHAFAADARDLRDGRPRSARHDRARRGDARTPSPGGATPATGKPAPPGSPPPSVPAAATAAAAAKQAATPSRTPAAANGTGGQDTHESAAARPSPLPDLPPRPPRRTTAAAPSRTDDDREPHRSRVGLIVGGGRIGARRHRRARARVHLGRRGNAARRQRDRQRRATARRRRSAAGGLDAGRSQGDARLGPQRHDAGRSRRQRRNTIEQKGFTIRSRGNNADQQIARSTVSYANGSEPAARIVAQIVGVAATAVQPIDANTAAAVPSDVKVVVIVGSDKSAHRLALP